MQRLLYVSESRITQFDVLATVGQIAERAQVMNARLGITGALIFTHSLFAQILEGPPEAVDNLMASIRDDIRHGNVVVVDKSPIASRRFPDWQLAYQGPSSFVSRHVAKLLHTTSQVERKRAIGLVTDLAYEFSKPLKAPTSRIGTLAEVGLGYASRPDIITDAEANLLA